MPPPRPGRTPTGADRRLDCVRSPETQQRRQGGGEAAEEAGGAAREAEQEAGGARDADELGPRQCQLGVPRHDQVRRCGRQSDQDLFVTLSSHHVFT